MKAKSKSANKVRSDDSRKKQAQISRMDEKAEVKHCFNCGGKNYLSVTYPSKEKSILCFQYSELGHIAANCSQRTKIEKYKSSNATQNKIEDIIQK